MSASDPQESDVPPLRLTIEGQIARIVFDRSGGINVITMDSALALEQAVAAVSRTPDVRALVISGAGRSFMAGGDLHYLHNAPPETAGAEAEALITVLHRAVERLAELPIPTLASVHGAAAGAGLSLMLACDFAIAAADTAFVFAYSQIAASPDGGLSWTLPRAIGVRKAMEFAFLGRRMTAAEALDCGLVTRLAAPEALAGETDLLVRELAALPTKAFGRTKRLMHDAGRASLGLQLANEMTGFKDSVGTRDFQEGVRAFFERRQPKFEGL